ncbi:MAG: hypothetical protein HZA31_05115 [Opitutae bacterium]|nr:hypothetical protein [Opitutae bacterium]
MMYYLVAFALLLHSLFWGAGLAWWLTPRRWQKFWPVFAPATGAALQSAVVWAGAYAGLAGANVYARASLLLPLGLLVSVFWRQRGARWADVRRFGAVWLAMAVCLAALVWPLARAAKGLTTASLGSCDAADYAAGARVLQEFSRGDRTGFLGLTEVVQVQSVDNFYDYWLRLNHFTPSALIAHHGAVLDCVPYEITGLVTACLLALSLPLVFWLARAGLGYRRGWAVGLAALYGASPLMWYAVYHVSPGQLLAAQAIALLTWAGLAMGRDRGAALRPKLAFAGLLAVAYWLLLGSYNFMIIVCLAPAVAWAGGRMLRSGRWEELARWLVAMLAPLVLAGVLFFERVAGLVERFQLFRRYDFGWRIPLLSPEGWLGLVGGVELQGWPLGVRLAASLVLIALLVWAVARAWRLAPARLFVAGCLVLPPLVGFGYLSLRGAMLGTNASYDAYKLLCVFYPGVLAGLCFGVTLARAGRWSRVVVAVVATLVVAGNLLVAVRFAQRMQSPPLLVDRPLLALREIERRPEVTSINLRIPDFWSRLWANAFLLRTPHYFPTHTYEGRLNTPLRGEWDLHGDVVHVIFPDTRDWAAVGSSYALVRNGSADFVGVQLGAGWHDRESSRVPAEQWRWTSGDAEIVIDNPRPTPKRIALRLDARGLISRDLQVWCGDRLIGTVALGTERQELRLPEMEIPAGTTHVWLRSNMPVSAPGGGDTRPLGMAVYRIEVAVRAITPR